MQSPTEPPQINEIRQRLHELGREAASDFGDAALNPRARYPDQLRPAAVLIGLLARPQGVQLLLTQRTDHLRHHAGQISFPGGRMEAQDADAVATALRETEEEVGIAPAQVEVVRALPRYRTLTGFVITPVVGVIDPDARLHLDTNEVAHSFELPLARVLGRENFKRHEREIHGHRRAFWVLEYGPHFIWGATAGMLRLLGEQLTRS